MALKKSLRMFKSKDDDAARVLTLRSKSEKVLFGVVFLVFFTYAASIIYPIIWMLINSFQDPLVYFNKLANGGNPFALPEVWAPDNYAYAFNRMYTVNSLGEKIFIPEMLFNSAWFCAFNIIPVLWYAINGYIFSKYKFRGRKFIYGFVMFTMTFPLSGTGGALFKLYYDIGFYNTPLMVVPGLMGVFGFSFLIMVGFYSNVSWHYAEAVFMDGGGHYTAFFKIMLPQATSMLITFGLLSFIAAWNDYMTPLLYLPDFPTLASGLYRIQISFTRTGNVPAFFAGLTFVTIPILAVFSFFGNRIMSNFSIGGLKG